MACNAKFCVDNLVWMEAEWGYNWSDIKSVIWLIFFNWWWDNWGLPAKFYKADSFTPCQMCLRDFPTVSTPKISLLKVLEICKLDSLWSKLPPWRFVLTTLFTFVTPKFLILNARLEVSWGGAEGWYHLWQIHAFTVWTIRASPFRVLFHLLWHNHITFSYEWFVSLDFEWEFISGKKKFRWPMVRSNAYWIWTVQRTHLAS